MNQTLLISRAITAVWVDGDDILYLPDGNEWCNCRIGSDGKHRRCAHADLDCNV